MVWVKIFRIKLQTSYSKLPGIAFEHQLESAAAWGLVCLPVRPSVCKTTMGGERKRNGGPLLKPGDGLFPPCFRFQSNRKIEGEWGSWRGLKRKHTHGGATTGFALSLIRRPGGAWLGDRLGQNKQTPKSCALHSFPEQKQSGI